MKFGNTDNKSGAPDLVFKRAALAEKIRRMTVKTKWFIQEPGGIHTHSAAGVNPLGMDMETCSLRSVRAQAQATQKCKIDFRRMENDSLRPKILFQRAGKK